VLVIGEQDILQGVSFEDVMKTIEEAMLLYEKKDFLMPARSHINYNDNTLLLMPCFTGEAFGTKLVTVFPSNSVNNAPVTNGVMILNDGATGNPVALINGRVLTAIRTAAVGGTGIRCLTPETVSRVGVIGAGMQGYYQALFACSARPVTDIYVYDMVTERILEFIDKLSRSLTGIRLHQVSAPEELLEASEVVITATTSEKPVLPNEKHLLEGKHFIGIGSFKPNMREYPEALFSILEQVFVDTEHALEETGDLLVPIEKHWIKENQVQTLGSILIDAQDKTKMMKNTTFFKSVGMALFDLCVSTFIYHKEKEKGLGQEIAL
jgi:ornithine cyclodeaminase/alanine dehydrogenase-like protein (mu-crystallin family)